MSNINYKNGIEQAAWLYRVAYHSMKEYEEDNLYEFAAQTRRDLETLENVLRTAGYTDLDLVKALEPARPKRESKKETA